jgi:anti-sigma factor RsiW
VNVMACLLRTDVTHEDLGAYVDGELDPIENACVEFAFAGDEELARTVAIYREQNAALRALFGDLNDVLAASPREDLSCPRDDFAVPACPAVPSNPRTTC